MALQKKEVVEINGKYEEITITEDRATEVVNEICVNNAKGIDLYFANCELITELRNNNGHYALGYNSFKELADELFESGETQAKNMCLIAQSFGKRNDDGSYTIIDKEVLKNFSATQLLYIRGLKDFNGNITETCEKYGISLNQSEDKVTTATLRALIAKEKETDSFLSLTDFLNPPQTEEADETSTDETSTDETSTDETSTDETSTEETSTEETSTDETSTEELQKSDKEKIAEYDKMANDYERVEFLAETSCKAIGDILLIIDGQGKATEKLDKIKAVIMALKDPRNDEANRQNETEVNNQ